VIIACAYLPVEVEKNPNTNTWEITGSSDSMYHIMYRISRNYPKVIWVGFLKRYFLIPEDEREQVVTLLKKQRFFCIKITEDVHKGFQEYMNVILISLFQYYSLFKDLYLIKNYDSLWKAYKEFNHSISKAVVENITTNEALIFINDYNLLLTPSFIHHNIQNIQNSETNVSIGLFMHRPFPASDSYRRLPNREEIIQSMMNCSSIFFHSYEATRNFITNCMRMDNINFESTKNGDLALNYFGRDVLIEVKQFSSEHKIIQV